MAHRARRRVEAGTTALRIAALIMDGITTESAFAQALDRPSLAW